MKYSHNYINKDIYDCDDGGYAVKCDDTNYKFFKTLQEVSKWIEDNDDADEEFLMMVKEDRGE